MDLKIDPEFKNWIMPLQEDEYKRLEMSIIESGCRDPLVVWNGILIDGHNRYKMCKEHGIDFKVHEMQFKSREEVKEWMIQNQLSRRNVTKLHRTYFIGKLYVSQKSKHGGVRKRGMGDEDTRTSGRLGKQFNMSKSTVERAGNFALNIDMIAINCGLDVRDKILSGDLAITKKEVYILANMEKNNQMMVFEKMREGLSSKRAIDSIYGDKTCMINTKYTSYDTFMLPCANPRCDREINITKRQYKEMVGVFPEKYGRISIPHCSKACLDAHTARVQARNQY
jgi:hypothetical protein